MAQFLKIAVVTAACVVGDSMEESSMLQLAASDLKRPTKGCLPTGHRKRIGVGACPITGMLSDGVSVSEAIEGANPFTRTEKVPTRFQYRRALEKLDIDAVEKDIKDLMHRNYSYWPNHGDYDHYGPFFIRLAWHCSGSYRASDGKGGCSGGRLRFEPERSWDDNTNLDKARTLLYPIKKKYGNALSWGDLYTFAGTAAIQDMGGPTKPFCFGRVDENSGRKSKILNEPCADSNAKKLPNGKCVGPWGTTTVGLIYVNPEGPIGADGKSRPDPKLSATDIKDAFGRMGLNAMETVALIGGGHAFGKVHGACSDHGPGDKPVAALKANSCSIWDGTCGGDGKGPNTVTSGFEGPWTNTPTQWGNDFFKGLLEDKWEKYHGPGGHYQWRTTDRASTRKDTMRLTSDMALLEDPAYKAMVDLFASDQGALDNAFAHAWTQLTEAGTKWSRAKKCQEIPTNSFSIGNGVGQAPTGWAAWMPQPAQ